MGIFGYNAPFHGVVVATAIDKSEYSAIIRPFEGDYCDLGGRLNEHGN